MELTKEVKEQISQNVRNSGVLSGKRSMTDAEWRKIEEMAELLEKHLGL